MRSPLTYSFATNIIANLRPKTRRGRLAALVISVALPCTVAFSASSGGPLGKLLFGRLSAERSAKSGRRVGGAMALGNVTLPPVQTTSDTSLSVARKGHTATLLTDGRVLIAGGENASGLVIQAEIFDPSAGTFSVTGNLNNSRADHSATRLADGRVLIAGGRSDLGALNTTEIFDPTSGTFTGGPNLNNARSGQSATVLGDGRIVLAGGDASGSVEIYDPQANAFTSLSANMSAPRAQHGAALLNDGRILFAGGTAPDGSPVRTGEVLDVVNASFAAVSNNTEDAHLRPLLRVLPDGKVQIIGGADHDDMEIYDEAANIFGAHVHVYPIGDEHPGLVQQILNSPVRAALFRNGVNDPLLDRSGETITELSGNQALVAGGVDSNGATLGSAAILSSSSATITTDKLDYPPGTPVIVSGSGWQANESVVVMLHEDPHVNTENPHTFTVQADGNGNFSFQEYAPEDADLGVSYIAAAVGQSSGWTAQTGFHDGNYDLQGQAATSPGSGIPTGTWITGSLDNWKELDTIPIRLHISGGVLLSGQTITIDFDHSKTGTPGIQNLTLPTATVSGGVTFATGGTPVLTSSTGDIWTYTLTVNKTAADGDITFTGNLSAGAHGFGGASLNLSGSPSMGILKITKPAAGPTTPDLAVTKTGPSTAAPGALITYTLGYSNSSGGANPGQATGSQLTDTLPTGLTFSSCSGGCSLTGQSVVWNLGTLAIGASASQTVTVTVGSGLSNGTSLINPATIASAENDANSANNSTTFTTTVATTATTLTVASALGTYGGTINLSATLTQTSNAALISGKTIVFSLNGSAVCGGGGGQPACPTTNGSGVASMSGVYLTSNGLSSGTRIAASSYGSGVGASFGGSAPYASSNGSNALTVNQKNLTISGAIAQNKTYNAITLATVDFSGASLVGVESGDTVLIDSSAYSASFATAGVGTNKPVTVTGVTLSGANSGNYTVSQPSGLTANITAKNLTISGAAANSREYNGGTGATVDFSGASLVTPVGGDTVGINSSGYSASFATKTVGTSKPVTVTGVTLSGADSGNYTVSQPSGLTANITALHVTGSFTGDNKLYNGNTLATVLTRSPGSVIGGDTVSLTGGTANFDTKDVGNDKTVTLTGGSLTGSDAGNYVLDGVSTTTANITAAGSTTTISCAPGSFTYTGSAITPCTATVTRVGDADTTATVTYLTNVNVGTNTAKADASYAGDANHTGSNATQVSFSITKAQVTAMAGSGSGTYNGSAQSPGGCLVTGAYKGDLTCTNSPTSVGPNAGTTTITPITSGTGLSNFDINPVNGSYTINKASTSITFNGPTSNADFTCGAAGTYTATLKDTSNNVPLSGIGLTLTIGSQTATGTTDGSGVATFSLVLNQAPGAPGETVGLTAPLSWSDANRTAPATPSGSFTVLPDSNVGPGANASTLYTGSRFFWTTSPTSSTATLTLTATIKDISANCAGDITKAKVSFFIGTALGGPWTAVSSAQNLPVGLVDPNDHTVGTASVISQYNLGKDKAVQLWVRIAVSGEYTYSGDEFDVPVTVAIPGQVNTMMAGGTLTNDGITNIVGIGNGFFANGYLGVGNGLISGGVLAGSVDFGGQVTYNKALTNPSGQLQITIHSYNKPDGTQDGKLHTYYVKSNSISEMTLKGQTASFSSKTNVYEIVGTSKNGIDGGGVMQFTSTPAGGQITLTTAAGSGPAPTFTCPATAIEGCMSVIVYKSSSGGVWFSSAWGTVGSLPQTVPKTAKPGSGSTVVQ